MMFYIIWNFVCCKNWLAKCLWWKKHC